MSRPCDNCESALEEGDLRCPICGLLVPDSAARPDRPSIDILRCDGCGAAVAFDIEAQAPRCGFCDATMHVESVEDPIEQTQAYLPLQVSSDRAAQALKDWMGSRGFFCPGDLKSKARLVDLKPLWWTGWVFDADAVISWTADSNEGAREADWAPHSGQTSMRFDNILISASRGLRESEIEALAPGYRISTAAPDRPEGDGLCIEQFDVQRSSARQKILDVIHGVASQRVSDHHVPGHRVRNLDLVACIEALQTARLAFPAYVLAYRYKDEVYRAVVHGQDATMVVGTAPTSWLRVLAVAGAVLAVILIGLALLGA